MVKKTGLGKGLDALFGGVEINEEEIQEKVNSGEEKVYSIKLIDIEPNRDQPRRIFDEDALEDLAKSIKTYGVIQPIIVNKKTDYYEIVAGERRWRAAKKAGLTEMPCIIKNTDARSSKEIALIENIQREDLNPIEKARSYKHLIEEYGLKQQDLADALGINRSTMANTIRILNLDPRVIDLALQGKLTEGHCRSLIPIEDPDLQYKYALKIIEKGGSVRDIERIVNNKRRVPKQEKAKYEAIYKDIENSFQGFFGTRVKLAVGKRAGKIVISYANNEELERILELVKKSSSIT